MKAIQITSPGNLCVADIPQPELHAGEVLVKIGYVGFCGSDLNTFLGRNPMVKLPVIPGHEIGATIEQVGADVPDTLAVGTTVQRALEVCVGPDCRIKEFEGWTNKFIFPPYDFSVADSMLVNFHLPYSTLLMLTAAFGGYENTMKAYDVALQEDYRFGVYGDCLLIVD